MVVDKNLQPVLLESPVLPEHKRVALVVLDFKDLTLHSTVPRGSNALRMRLLKRLGYAVLEVSIHLLLSLTLASFFPTWAVADEKRMKLNKLLFCDV